MRATCNSQFLNDHMLLKQSLNIFIEQVYQAVSIAVKLICPYGFQVLLAQDSFISLAVELMCHVWGLMSVVVSVQC